MNILDKILESTRKVVISLPEIADGDLKASKRNFLEALEESETGIIAEIKQCSPSEGIICEDFNPIKIAKEYEQGRACAISVLTDKEFFNGSYENLKAVRDAVDLPLLCKDFIIDKKQIRHARKAGADACLLIVRILTDNELVTLKDEIEYFEMTPIIEVFDETDIERALKVGAKIIGINNRNLDTLYMNTDNSNRLLNNLPDDVLKLSFSGVKTPEDIKNTIQVFDGVLVGTALLKSDDRKVFLRSAIL